MTEPAYRLRSAGREVGAFTARQLHRIATRQEMNEPLEFWNEFKQSWRPLSFFAEVFDPPDRTAAMRDSGISHCRVLGAGITDGIECKRCRALQHRKRFLVAEAPALPPAECYCRPWCRCVLIPVE